MATAAIVLMLWLGINPDVSEPVQVGTLLSVCSYGRDISTVTTTTCILSVVGCPSAKLDTRVELIGNYVAIEGPEGKVRKYHRCR